MGEDLEDDGKLLGRIASSAEAARIVGAQEAAANLLQRDLAYKSAEVIYVNAASLLEVEGALTSLEMQKLDERSKQKKRSANVELLSQSNLGGIVNVKAKVALFSEDNEIGGKLEPQRLKTKAAALMQRWRKNEARLQICARDDLTSLKHGHCHGSQQCIKKQSFLKQESKISPAKMIC